MSLWTLLLVILCLMYLLFTWLFSGGSFDSRFSMVHYRHGLRVGDDQILIVLCDFRSDILLDIGNNTLPHIDHLLRVIHIE